MINLLIIDNSKDDAELLTMELANKGMIFNWQRVANETDLYVAYSEQSWDIVLCDINMPQLTPKQLLKITHDAGNDIPVIIVSGSVQEDQAIKLLEAGARDFLSKDNLARLPMAIHRELLGYESRQALLVSEERFRSVTQSAHDAIISINSLGNIIFWNQGAQISFGYKEEEVVGRNITLLMPDRFRTKHQQGLIRVLTTGEQRVMGHVVELTGLRKNGDEFPLEIAITSWSEKDGEFFTAVIRDITERQLDSKRREATMQSQLAITALLETTMEPLSLTRQLEVALDIITTVSWIGVHYKGSVFLLDNSTGNLNLGASRGLSEKQLESCGQLFLGECLCGQAAQSGEIVTSVPDENSPDSLPCDDQAIYGHHCVPILSGKNLLGVFSLFFYKNHVCNPEVDAFLTTIARTLAAVIERRRMEEAIRNTQEELRETRLDVIRRLGVAAEYRDSDTGEHIIRMSQYAAALGRSMGMSPVDVDLLLHATPMHDVGKIGIPDHILLKPGKLTQDEFNIIKKHVSIGASMLYCREFEPLKTAHIIALTHHEKWDGSGYPNGLSGEDIPLLGRICALVDVFDALTMDRPYKKAWSTKDALAEIELSSGSHFDPSLVESFKGIFPEILQIKESFSSQNSVNVL